MNFSQYVERSVSGRFRETERLSRLTGHGRQPPFATGCYRPIAVIRMTPPGWWPDRWSGHSNDRSPGGTIAPAGLTFVSRIRQEQHYRTMRLSIERNPAA